MRLAIVYDRVNKWGGAERVLLALHEIWPDAPLYTAVYDKRRASWANVFQIHPTFLQHVPFASRHHEFFPWLTPMAFESFSWEGYDVVLSVTSAEAKDIITKPGTTHICYCLTPTRYLWSGVKDYMGHADSVSSGMLKLLSPTLKKWDLVAATKPDYYLAISDHVAKRVQKYYHRTVEKVIYPPIDTTTFTTRKTKPEDYFLCVSRLVPYKRVDIIVEAFNTLGWPLKIIGKGSGERMLKQHAKQNIEFVGGDLTDTALVTYDQRCRAFVFAGEEDFGIASLEAQACGKPVISYRNSGMAETVIEGKTGILFDEQSVASLIDALQKFNKGWYDSGLCRRNAVRFGKTRFMSEMKAAVCTLAQQT